MEPGGLPRRREREKRCFVGLRGSFCLYSEGTTFRSYQSTEGLLFQVLGIFPETRGIGRPKSDLKGSQRLQGARELSP